MTCNHHTYKIIMMVSVLSPWFWKIWEDFFVARLIRSKNCGGRTGGQRGFGGKGKTGFDVFSRVLWLPFSFCSESRIKDDPALLSIIFRPILASIFGKKTEDVAMRIVRPDSAESHLASAGFRVW